MNADGARGLVAGSPRLVAGKTISGEAGEMGGQAHESPFFKLRFGIARTAIVDKRWNDQIPQDGRCDVAR